MTSVVAPARVETTARPAGRRIKPAPDRARHHLGPYLGYIGYFVGAGLISGGIVHYPLDPSRYTIVALAGIALFIAATLLNEVVLPGVRRSFGAVATLVAAALVLSLGIGMLSGGIQHFTDFPARAALLIPLGLVTSFVAYVVKHASRRRMVLVRLGLVVLAAAGALAWGLSQVATGLVAAGEHGHEHAVVGSSEGETGSEHVEPVVVQRTDIEHSNPVLRSPATTAQTHDDAHGEGHDDETHDDDAHGDAHRQ